MRLYVCRMLKIIKRKILKDKILTIKFYFLYAKQGRGIFFFYIIYVSETLPSIIILFIYLFCAYLLLNLRRAFVLNVFF